MDDRIRILQAELEGSGKALKVNYSKDNCEHLHGAPFTSPTSHANAELGGIVLKGALWGEA